jgi:aerobic carbon-monoxide dehydrogenase small subunit
MSETISFVLNEKPVVLQTDPLRRLLDVLREDFELTGAKEGCGQGECGACAVLLDHRLVNSCILPVIAVDGKQVLTIEGYRETERFQVLSKCFEDAGAVQCGFCTPGMLMAAEALLSQNPEPDEEKIRTGLSGNLCRCTGYTAMVKAVATAAKEGAGLWPPSIGL